MIFTFPSVDWLCVHLSAYLLAPVLMVANYDDLARNGIGTR